MNSKACQKADTQKAASENGHPSRVLPLSLGGIVLASLILRGLCSGGELWLDEIITLNLVRGLRHPWEILTNVLHDNNHLFNSLWMWFCGETAQAWLHRLPSIIFGPISVYLLARSMRILGEPVVGLIWALFVGTSYVFVLATSEARGYSLEVLCATLCFDAIVRLLKTPYSLRAARSFGIYASLGILAHASFFLFLGPAAMWLIWTWKGTSVSTLTRKAVYTAVLPPMVITLAMTMLFYPHMIIGGAPIAPYLDVGITTLSVAVGGEALSDSNKSVSIIAYLVAAFTAALALTELALWRRERSPIPSLVGAILIAPPIVVLLLQPEFILPRYFLIALLFLYLLGARLVVRLTTSGIAGKIAGTLLVSLFVFFNTKTTLRLWQQGRSHFMEIFQLIVATTAEDERTVGGAQDIQNSYRLAYACAVDPKLGSITYVKDVRNTPTPPNFMIWETLDQYEQMPTRWTSKQGTIYERIAEYSAVPLNGSATFVYRRVDR